MRFLSDIAALAKPRITLLVLFTTSVGLWLAPLSVSPSILLATLCGMVAAVGGVNALNMYAEREVDGLMSRTQNRPLPTGRLHPSVALWFGLTLSIAGTLLVGWQVNLLSGFLVLVAVTSCVLLYTPIKQVSPWALPVGAIPGAMPPPDWLDCSDWSD